MRTRRQPYSNDAPPVSVWADVVQDASRKPCEDAGSLHSEEKIRRREATELKVSEATVEAGATGPLSSSQVVISTCEVDFPFSLPDPRGFRWRETNAALPPLYSLVISSKPPMTLLMPRMLWFMMPRRRGQPRA